MVIEDRLRSIAQVFRQYVVQQVERLVRHSFSFCFSQECLDHGVVSFRVDQKYGSPVRIQSVLFGKCLSFFSRQES